MRNSTSISEAGIGSQLNTIVTLLHADRKQHSALSHANFLLTELLGLLRPVRDAPRGPALTTRCAATHLGLGERRTRELTDVVADGIQAIEQGQLSEAVETFENAREQVYASALSPGGSGA